MSNLDKNTTITKASGEKALFDLSKLRRSLERSGANEMVVLQVLEEIQGLLYNGITTEEIYKKAFSLLQKSSRSTASRYKLKKAIYELGPTGFPFEKFVAAILKYEGFQTEIDVIVKGHCVNHEVDIVAEKEDKHFMVECKFHNDQGRVCDVKIPLYIHSRFLDVEKQWKQHPGHEFKFHQGWIFTNTRFTFDAIQYGNCSGLMLVGWDYPKKGSLKERIDLSGLHPITSMTTITNYEKKKLLAKEKVLCMEIYHHPELLNSIGISEKRHKRILKEAQELCGT
ncbi:ATP cone domain-containing protein [Echinicola shivajiensis]|uniref:ATP cone domain-containing protein n=1 Tax=Echinicola shivajiensis TaxID=1035916 RepID=UPI001BFCD193|nr:ATP cone domain-containing protein [Echinicola shivajiensis]